MRQRDLFTNGTRLFEELCTIERLSVGFNRAKKNKGSPGIDGVTIEDFGSSLPEELSRLKEKLESWTYKPSPIRRVEIPKPGGKGIRLLGVPTVRDRSGACHPERAVRTDLRSAVFRAQLRISP